MNLPTNEVMRFPSGKWGFVGRVSISLLYGRKDDKPLTHDDEAEIVRLNSVGARFVTGKGTAFKRLVWDTRKDAEACLATVVALDTVERKAAESWPSGIGEMHSTKKGLYHDHEKANA